MRNSSLINTILIQILSLFVKEEYNIIIENKARPLIIYD